MTNHSNESNVLVSLPPKPELVVAVHKIANHLNRVRGYATTISECDVRTVMEATTLLVEQARTGCVPQPKTKRASTKGIGV